MKRVIPTIETEGFFLVKFAEKYSTVFASLRANSLKPACIYKYKGPTKYKHPRLYVEWFNGFSATVEPEWIEVFELINKPVETTKEQPKKVIYPALRSCFMKNSFISVPIISGSVFSESYESEVIIHVTTDDSRNRTIITLNPDGTYSIG